MTENHDDEQNNSGDSERLKELQARFEKLEDFILDDRERRIQRIQRIETGLKAQRAQGYQQQKLLLVLAGAVFVALAGVSYQDGKFSWLFDTEKARHIIELVGTISTLAAGVGAGAVLVNRQQKRIEAEDETTRSEQE